MINHVYLLLIDMNWAFGDRQIESEIFYNVEDAREYMNMYADSLINDIWQDSKEYYSEDIEKFYQDIEVNKYLDEVCIYLDDCCDIYIDITKKDIMSM